MHVQVSIWAEKEPINNKLSNDDNTHVKLKATTPIMGCGTDLSDKLQQ